MKVIENEEILMPLRYVKDNEEIDAMKNADEVASKGVTAAIGAIRPNVTEMRLLQKLNMQ